MLRLLFVAARFPERVVIFPVAVAILELMMKSCPVILAMLEFVLARLHESDAIVAV